MKNPCHSTDRTRGSAAGRQQKSTDAKAGAYPRTELVFDGTKSQKWMDAYREAYYQTKKPGRKIKGSRAREKISLTCDPDLFDQAQRLNIKPSDAIDVGLRIMIERINPHTLTDIY